MVTNSQKPYCSNAWDQIPIIGLFSFSFEQTDSPPLSPYPFVRIGSPRRIQLSQNHPVYISPHKNEPTLSPREKIFYYFSSSPSKVSQKGFNLLL